MENPREIASTIKLFEGSFEEVDRFLQNYHQLGQGDLSKPTAPTPKSMPGGGSKPNGSSSSSSMPGPRPSAVDTASDNNDAELDQKPSSSNNEPSSLDQAKKDLVDAYAINSIFWMYLCVQGVDPRNHHIKHELERIRKYMNLIKEATDKQKAPKLNVKASKRLMRGAMFDTNESNKKVKKEKQTL